MTKYLALLRIEHIRARFKDFTEGNWITGASFLLSLTFAGLFGLHISPVFNVLPKPELDLAGQWEICVPKTPDPTGCAWHPIKVPSDVPRGLMDDFQGWLIYRKHFTAPASCLAEGAACAFFFEEVGDSAEARVNGHMIGRHGQFPPNASYAKHYPVRLQVSRDTLRPEPDANELILTVYALKQVQSGVRGWPIGLYSVDTSFRLTQKFTTSNVVIPVLCFVGLFIIAALSLLVAGPELRRDPKFAAFVRYGLAASCFLLSISEVPREYLPIGVAGFLHFALRILYDWSFFELVASYFDYGSRVVRWLRPFYILVLIAFAVQFFIFCIANGGIHGGQGFDVGYLTLRLSLPLLLLPHLMGLYSGIRRRDTWQGRAAIPLFAMTLLFQVHDSLIFHGYASGIYYVKWYPVFTGLIFGLFFLERSREARAKECVEQEQMKQMEMIHQATVGVAHDLEEPLKGLEMACKELQRHPDNRDLVKAIADTFPTKVQRIYELNKAILSYSKELSKPLELKTAETDLVSFLQSVADEFRPLPLLQGIALSVVAYDSAVPVLIDQMQIRRVIRNLIRNAAEACAGKADARIDIEVRSNRLKQGVEILVSDNGPGVSEAIKARLFQPFETHGKEHGTGLGLAMSRRLVEAHGGSMSLMESSVGACFQVVLI